MAGMILLIYAVSLAGLPAGMLVAHMAKEELKAGRRYFRICQDVLFSLATVLFLYALNIRLILAVTAGFLIMLILRRIKSAKTAYAAYPTMAIMLGLSINTMILPHLASVMFLYGLPTAALIKKRKRK